MRFSSISFLIGIAILSFIGIGQTLYHANNTKDIYKETDNITANLRQKLHFNVTDLSNVSIEDRNTIRLTNLIYYSFNFIAGVAIEFVGFGIEYGYTHYWWDALKIGKTIIYLMIALIIIKLIIPLIVIIYLIVLLIRYIKDRK